MSERTSEMLMFRVGSRVFACDVQDVRRIGSPLEVPPEDLLEETPLGRPFSQERGLVVVDASGELERTVVVDHVLGVSSIPEEHVQPLPPFAAACMTSGAVAGFVLLDDTPTLLVDLPTLVREHVAPPRSPEERP